MVGVISCLEQTQFSTSGDIVSRNLFSIMSRSVSNSFLFLPCYMRFTSAIMMTIPFQFSFTYQVRRRVILEQQTYLITFDNVSSAEANRYAEELREFLLDASSDVEVQRR